MIKQTHRAGLTQFTGSVSGVQAPICPPPATFPRPSLAAQSTHEFLKAPLLHEWFHGSQRSFTLIPAHPQGKPQSLSETWSLGAWWAWAWACCKVNRTGTLQGKKPWREGHPSFTDLSAGDTIKPRFFPTLSSAILSGEFQPSGMIPRVGKDSCMALAPHPCPTTPETMKEKEGTSLLKGQKPFSKSHPYPCVLMCHWPKWHHLPNPESRLFETNEPQSWLHILITWEIWIHTPDQLNQHFCEWGSSISIF